MVRVIDITSIERACDIYWKRLIIIFRLFVQVNKQKVARLIVFNVNRRPLWYLIIHFKSKSKWFAWIFFPFLLILFRHVNLKKAVFFKQRDELYLLCEQHCRKNMQNKNLVMRVGWIFTWEFPFSYQRNFLYAFHSLFYQSRIFYC